MNIRGKRNHEDLWRSDRIGQRQRKCGEEYPPWHNRSQRLRKTTFVNIVTGFVKPDKGSVLFNGNELIGLPPYRVTNIGVGRAFQMAQPTYLLTKILLYLWPSTSQGVPGREIFGDKDAVALDVLERSA